MNVDPEFDDGSHHSIARPSDYRKGLFPAPIGVLTTQMTDKCVDPTELEGLACLVAAAPEFRTDPFPRAEPATSRASVLFRAEMATHDNAASDLRATRPTIWRIDR